MIVTIEGSIGSGKSTLLSKLKDASFCKPHRVVFEPIDEWLGAKADGDNKSLFEHFYMEMKRYGFMFQMYTLKSRFEHMMKCLNKDTDEILIFERSHQTDREIFAKMLKRSGVISEAEYYVYESWFECVEHVLHGVIKGMVYLRVDCDVCLERIIKRNRKGESNMKIEYLRDLEEMHENWLLQKPNVLTIDGNGESCDVNAIINYINNLFKDGSR